MIAVTECDPYVMPRIEELLDYNNGMSTIFFNPRHDERLLPRTDGIWGQVQNSFFISAWKIRLQSNAIWIQECPSHFSKAVDALFDQTQDFIVTYIDDIAVYSQTWWENHLQYLREQN